MPSVDNRVVEMRFDNKEFETGVSTSLGTIDKLKSALKFEGATKGLDDISTAAGNVSLDGISSSVSTLASHFTALQLVADQVFRRIGDAVADLGSQFIGLIKSLSFDQVSAGFTKYEGKTKSVQTIMNATGKSIDEVSASLDKLNWFTDETSYSYESMTDNISKFTSSGIDLDTAITSMIGIADAAGLAGASVGDASHAMDGFSKAIAQGYMSRQNWQWIRTAHMDTAQFKKSLIEAAVEVGTLTETSAGLYQSLEGTTVSVADFETALKDGWMNVDVMNTALEAFGGTTNEIYEEYLKTGDLTSNIIANMAVAADDLGLKAFKASQEARTFTDAIDSVKDAVSTGWMVSFEYIFGNYEEAVQLWTTVANELWDVFNGGAEARNEMLRTWHDGIDGVSGYKLALEALSNVWDGVISIINAFKSAWADIFPPMTAQRLIDITQNVKDFSERFSEAWHYVDETEAALGEIIKPSELIKKANEGVGDSFIAAYSDAATGEVDRSSKSIVNLQNIIRGIASVIDIVKQTFSAAWNVVIKPALSKAGELFSPVIDFFGQLGVKITEFASSLRENNTIATVLQNIVDKLGTFKDRIVEFVNSAKELDSVKTFLGYFEQFKTWLSGIKDSVFDKISSFFKNLEGLDLPLPTMESALNALDSIVSVVNKLVDAVKNGFPQMKEFFGGLDFSGAGNFLSSAKESIVNFISGIFSDDRIKESASKGLSNLWEGFKEGLSGIDFGDVFKNVLKGVEVGGITALTVGLGKFFTGLGDLFSGASSFPDALVGILNNLGGVLKGYANDLNATALLKVAGAIAILSAALAGLSFIPVDQLDSAAVALFVIIGAVSILVSALGKLGSLTGKIGSATKNNNLFNLNVLSNFGKEKFSSVVLSIAAALISFGAAVKMLSSALSVMDGLDTDRMAESMKKIVTFLVTAGAILAVLGTISGVTKNKTPYASMGLAFIEISAALVVMASALRKIAAIGDLDALKEAMSSSVKFIIAAGLALASLGAIQGFSKNTVNYSQMGFAFVEISAALVVMASALRKIVAIGDLEALKVAINSSVKFIIAAAAALAILGGIQGFSKNTVNYSQIGFSFLEISAAVLVMASALKKVAAIGDLEALKVAMNDMIGFIVAAGVALGVLGGIQGFSKNEVDYTKIGLAFIELSAALIVLAAALKVAATIPTEQLTSVALTLGLLTAALVALAAVTGIPLVADGMIALSIGLVAFGAAVLAAGAGAYLFAEALKIMSSATIDAKAAGENLALGIVAFVQTLMANGQVILQFVSVIIIGVVGIILAKKAYVALAGAETVVALIEAISTKLPLILTLLGGFLALILEWLGVNMGTLTSSIVSLIVILINDIAIALIQNGQALGEAVGHVLKAILLFIGEWIEGLLNGIIPGAGTRLLGAINDYCSETVDTIEASNEELYAAVKEGGEEMRRGLGDGASGIDEDAGEMMDGVVDAVSGAAPRAEKAGKEVGNAVADGVSSTTPNAVSEAESMADGVTDALSIDLTPTATGDMSSFLSGLTGGSSDVNSFMTTFAGNFGDQFSMDLASSGQGDMSSFLSGLTSGSVDVNTFANTFSGDLGDTFNIDGTMFANGDSAMDNYESGMSGRKSSVVDAASGIASDAASAVSDYEQDYYTTGADNATNLAKGMNDNTKSVTNAGANLGKAGVGNGSSGAYAYTEDFYATGQKYTSFLASGMNKDTSAIVTAGANLGKVGVGNRTSGAYAYTAGFYTTGQKYDSYLASGINKDKSSVSTAGANAAASGVSGAKSGYDDMYEVGEYLTDGLAAGINSYKAQNKVVNAAANIATIAVNKTKAYAQVKSPSRATMEIGRYLTEGLAIGIADKAEMAGVEKSSANTAKLAIKTIGGMISDIAETVDKGIEYEPVIRPVLDLTDIQSGAGKLNNLMNYNRALTASEQFSGRYTMQVNSKDQTNTIITAIKGLQDDVNCLGGVIAKMRIMLDTGVMVGQMIDPIDTELGRRQFLAGRGV